MKPVLRGRVQSGKNDASHWLSLFNEAYSHKLGSVIYPGSLNLVLDESFEWSAPRLKPHTIHFLQEEYGGERDILLLPCILASLGRRTAWLWSTTTAAESRPDPRVVEVIYSVKLRDMCGLCDGDFVTLEVPA
jgi:CTP-dependent riboflavin kinase